MATDDARARRRKTRRRRTAIAAAGLVVVTGASIATAAAVNGAEPRWQLSRVTTGSVTQTIESSGTVSAANKAAPSFSVSGTVKSVAVKVGQNVSKGDVLAKLDTTSLQSDIDSAKSTLANAAQKLEADKTGQTSDGGTAVSPSAYTGSSATVTAAVATSSGTTVLAAATTNGSAVQEVQAAQDAVIAAQKAVDGGQAAVDAAQKPVDDDIKQNLNLSDTQKAACSTSSKRSDGADGSSVACTEAQANYEASAHRLATDMSALDSAIAAQDKFVAALDSSIASLDAAITKLLASNASGASGGSGTGGSGAGGSGTGQSGTGGSGQSGAAPGSTESGGGATASAQPASAAQLAADQAAIDSADAAVTEAEQNLAAATLTSPISGTVAAVGLTAGASSSGASITIVGAGIQKVSTTVPLSHIDLVRTGQAVTVAADGVATTLHGTVTSIGMLSTTTGSTTTFPVTVTLDDEQPSLYDGTGADVVITTGTAENVVTVANSAVHAGPRGTYTVTVLKNGVTSTKTVTLGVAGPDVTEVKTGLAVGDQVVVADVTEDLPSSTTSTTNGRTGFGGFSGFAPGGFPGGR
jgi:multidrug efflux pump subunit AcrA (membrane-fusion protein)